MDNWAIRCRQVGKRFGPQVAVDRADLSLAPGRFLALLGPSGCGKTTMLRLIAGFEKPDEGIIEIADRQVVGPGVFVRPEHRRVGLVFQNYALFPHLDVARNVGYGLPSGAGRTARVDEMLALVGLAGLGRRMPHELSGGQQQRVALARALAPAPRVLLLDEPFSNLDAGLRTRVRAEVREILRRAGATAIFVTHDQEEALSLADEVAVMSHGRIVQTATPEDLYWRPTDRAAAAFVGEANFLPGEVRSGLAWCELGILPALGDAGGAVEVMIRPETVRPVPDRGGQGTVVSREFFGHDQVVQVRLDSGRLLRCRLGPEPAPPLGARVRLQVERAVVVFACRPQPVREAPSEPGDPVAASASWPGRPGVVEDASAGRPASECACAGAKPPGGDGQRK